MQTLALSCLKVYTDLSRKWVDVVEKKKRDTKVVLSHDDVAVDVCHATGPRRLGEGVLPFDLATIKVLPSAAEESTTNESPSISMNTFAE